MSKRVCQSIERNRVIAIIRRVYQEELLKLATALSLGGIKLVEVTFDQTDALCLTKTLEAIDILRTNLKPDVHVGAGTVLDLRQVEMAKKAGAEFIISPNSCKAIIERTKELGMVSIPGALTPTEIVSADQAGADFVKIFPVNYLNKSYLNSIQEPLGHVKYIATGGVDGNNIGDFLKNGYVGAGIGKYLSEPSLIHANDFDQLKCRAELIMSFVMGETKNG